MGDFVSYNTYQPTEEDNAPLAQDNTVQQTGTVHSITINGSDGRYASSGVQSFSAAEDFSVFDAGDWRSTARSAQGFPTNEIGEDSVVTIGGISSPVKVFVTTGVLQKQGNEYVLAGGQQTQQGHADAEQQQDQQQQQQQAQGDDSAAIPDDVAQAMNAAAEPFSQPVYDNGVALGIAHALGDIPIESVAAGVAKNSGMEPGDVAQRTEFIINSFQSQADHFITGRLGVAESDLQDFYAFAREPANKGALRDALNGQLYGGSMAAWRPLVDRYISNTAPSAAALKSRGFETKQGADGADLVRINGTWMSLKAAARAGLI
ncbi:hypothetical protein [Ralstonia pseudosolanacearum]|uniref:hypothetical protein n=1 Tax=Ralstonia pseudosolanacearum TaxID=1310165 RepID=UPI00048B11D7|nr:hypothetical protein [Ralstonia pseudosolanacearum]MDO3579210.1 hypothetical protein [Ralstonia pseudosolanacearum]MDO3588989.1 hypothetical protein [Ralstonia pseudosolanacearum]